MFPHHAAVPGLTLEYLHPPLPKPTGSALTALVERFSPATVLDGYLIGAFFMTLFWGGPPGARRAYNADRPHRSLGYVAPAVFAARCVTPTSAALRPASRTE